MPNNISQCCNAPLETHIADEGTGCNICSKCGRDSDPVSEPLVAKLLLDWWQAWVSQEMIDDHFTCWISEDVEPEEMQNYLAEKIIHLTQQVREDEQLKALEIAKACVINRKVGSPCPLVVTEKMYEQVLKVGMQGVEALRKEV